MDSLWWTRWTASPAELPGVCSIASSSDGSKLVVSAASGQICTSTNAGATWTERIVLGATPPHSWSVGLTAVASSSDGTKLVAVVRYGNIYTSVDSGSTWTERDSNRPWQTVASSSDGTKLVAHLHELGLWRILDCP